MSSDEDEQRALQEISEELARRHGSPDGASEPVRRTGTNHRRDAEEDIPPGPWLWQRVSPEEPDLGDGTRGQAAGEALVDAEGTWLVWAEAGAGFPDVNPDARELLAKAWLLERLPDLFELWDACRYADTPVERGAALTAFTTLMRELRSSYEQPTDRR